MIENQNSLNELLEKYSRDDINESEFNELCGLIDDPKNDSSLKEILEHDFADGSFTEMNKGQLDIMLANVLKPQEKGKVRKLFPWRRIAAAAAIIITIAGGSYFLLTRNNKQEIATNEPQENKFKNDVASPKKAKATITLSDGSIVALDSATTGTLATQGDVSVVKTADGKIIYNGSAKDVVYNTLTNPRGSLVIDMTLADGSRVWLNAGSSVTYPVAFVGNERKVSITGEAYFEVKHNSAMPFKVNKGEMDVLVFGTHFNVNAYEDEANIKVTLLEGSVKVVKGSASGFLKPGQQAILRQTQNDNEIKVVSDVNTEEVMAWKNGGFYFDGADIQTIMRQVGRWYDVEVVYESGIPTGHYNGKPSRDLTASEMLKVVEYSGVKVRIEGRKIIILK